MRYYMADRTTTLTLPGNERLRFGDAVDLSPAETGSYARLIASGRLSTAPPRASTESAAPSSAVPTAEEVAAWARGLSPAELLERARFYGVREGRPRPLMEILVARARVAELTPKGGE